MTHSTLLQIYFISLCLDSFYWFFFAAIIILLPRLLSICYYFKVLARRIQTSAFPYAILRKWKLRLKWNVENKNTVMIIFFFPNTFEIEQYTNKPCKNSLTKTRYSGCIQNNKQKAFLSLYFIMLKVLMKHPTHINVTESQQASATVKYHDHDHLIT